MNRCPITYEPCETPYSKAGLKRLSSQLSQLRDFPYGLNQQLELAIEYSDKLSFSGVQPKLNAKLNGDAERFEVVRSAGTFILKLQHAAYQQLPENEDVTMKMAAIARVETPLEGMIYAVDRSLVYFVKRFDRRGKKKFPVEDFGQLAGLASEEKYDFSVEKLIAIIDKFCTFKVAEKAKLLRLVLFNFLVGNEDAHVKNFSLIREGGVTKLAPAYDLVNSTIVMKSKEEMALSMNGKKSNFKRGDFVEYLAQERLALPLSLVNEILSDLENALFSWRTLLSDSFLLPDKKAAYLKLVEERAGRLFFMK